MGAAPYGEYFRVTKVPKIDSELRIRTGERVYLKSNHTIGPSLSMLQHHWLLRTVLVLYQVLPQHRTCADMSHETSEQRRTAGQHFGAGREREWCTQRGCGPRRRRTRTEGSTARRRLHTGPRRRVAALPMMLRARSHYEYALCTGVMISITLRYCR